MNSLNPYIEEFHLLTPEQLKYVTNGCGPKLGYLDLLVPDFMYLRACQLHDWIYWSGGPKRIRELADRKLQNDIAAINNGLPWYKRWALVWTPSVYYRAVRLFGEAAFHRAPYRRTRKDLEVEMSYG